MLQFIRKNNPSSLAFVSINRQLFNLFPPAFEIHVSKKKKERNEWEEEVLKHVLLECCRNEVITVSSA